MPTFKRASLGGSEDLFRPTRPQVVSDTDDVIKDSVDRHVQREPVVYRTLSLTAEEIELLIDAIQTAKYPDRPRQNSSDASGTRRSRTGTAAGARYRTR
ncbi:MAG: hypothetical protein AUI15_31615 [Actinobacteria bacterium 13_2_20CM_2_66_6]|nr:MAG: hypothetical protein AUI15_31615 [Actinobacteria bacterium 13_2_20CM_2_66_6]